MPAIAVRQFAEVAQRRGDRPLVPTSTRQRQALFQQRRLPCRVALSAADLQQHPGDAPGVADFAKQRQTLGAQCRGLQLVSER
jgi:hypothetical protein